MLAIAGLKDFDDALTSDLPLVHPTTGADLPNNLKKRQAAWFHLMLALDKEPLYLVHQLSPQNPYTAWNMLTARYQPTDTDTYTRINREIKTLNLESPFDNPGSWMTELCHLNK